MLLYNQQKDHVSFVTAFVAINRPKNTDTRGSTSNNDALVCPSISDV